MFESYLLFFFAALGSFNGLALSLYLLWRQPVTAAQRWLAALVLMISLRTGKSALFYFWDDISDLVLQIGLTALILIGICLVGFVRAWADPERQRTRKDPFFFLGLLVIAIVFGMVYPYSINRNLWRELFLPIIMLGWFMCLVLAAWLFFRAVRQPLRSEAHETLTNTQVGTVIGGVAAVWLAYETAGLTSYIVGALSFSVVLYFSAMVALAQRSRAASISASLALEPPAAEPYKDRKIAPTEADVALQSLHKLMADENLYMNADLTLSKVARRLNIPPARLSQLLNDNHKTPFKQYLAQVRIEAAKKLLREPAPVSMEQIAEASGFLSMSTFYSSFRKVVGTTPAAWRQSVLLKPDS